MTALDGSSKSLFHLPKAALLPFKSIPFSCPLLVVKKKDEVFYQSMWALK